MKQKTVPELLSEDSVGFANSIYIINIGGYIGQNPRSEIEYANFCPGWKAFFTHQDEETKAALRDKYDFKKYQ